MRMLGMLAAWGVLAVLGTMCFALGGSLGYRRGVKDTLTQIRERRTGNAGCRPLPANHLRRRTSGHTRPGARARRARWRPRHVGASVVGPTRAAVPVRRDPRLVALSVTVAAILLIGVPGAAIGATTAQPGEPLYTVRRSLEHVRVVLARGPASDTEVHVELAAARLTDLRGLVGPDVAPEVVADVSSNLNEHATAATDHLARVENDLHQGELEGELGRRLKRVVDDQVEVMHALALDCGASDERDCAALNGAKNASVALRMSTDRQIVVAEGTLDPPERAAVQADEAVPGETVTAEPVEEPPTDEAAAAVTDDARETPAKAQVDDSGGKDGGDEAPTTATATATASEESASPPPAKPNPGAQPTSAPAPSPSPSSDPTPPASAGSSATELDKPTDSKATDAGAKAAATEAETEDAGE